MQTVCVMDMFVDSLIDALKDSARMLPFLFAVYLIMEILEHRAGRNFPKVFSRTSGLGPLMGGRVGAVPQCGLAAASASLYSGRVITLGTLLAVFLSSSDEMLPMMLSEAVPVLSIVKILAVKIAIGVVSGYAVDLLLRRRAKTDDAAAQEAEAEFEDYEHHSNVVLCAVRHSLKVFLYVLILSVLMNIAISIVGEDALAAAFNSIPVVGELAAALIGLIPNCASSVVITQLYLDGIIGAGPMFAGLLVNAGVGVIVLLRTNRNARENFWIVVSLYAIGVLWGVLIEFSGIVF